MYPLGIDLSKFKDDELQTKYSELSKRLTQAYKFGPASVVPQIQMLLGDYQSEISRRQQKIMDEMLKQAKDSGKSFDGIINIE